MMDFIEVERELKEVAEKQREMCEEYRKIRKEFGNAKYNLFVLLTPKQDDKEYRKASVDKQLIMLQHETLETHKTEIYGYYETYIKKEQEYKGLEHLIDALASRISALQSLMKWSHEGEKFGG